MENSKSNNNNNEAASAAAKSTTVIAAAADANNQQRVNPDGGNWPYGDSSSQVVEINANGESGVSAAVDSNGGASRRTPFTNLSQEDADLALARTLQEQVFALSPLLGVNTD